MRQQLTARPSTRRLGVGVLIAGLVAAGTPGCGSGSGSGSSGDELKIAVAGPMTGNDAQYGRDFWRGANLAADDINKASGKKAATIALQKFDDVDDTTQAANVAQKISSDRSIDAVIGHFTSPTVFATMPIYEKNQIPHMVISASNPDITKRGDEWLFRVSPAITMLTGKVATALAEQVKPEKVAALYLNTDYGTADHASFMKDAKEAGLNVVMSASYQPDTKDFTNIVLKLKQKDPDVVYLSSYYNDAALIVRQATSAGYDGIYFSPGSLYSPAYIKVGGQAVEGNTYTTSVPRTDKYTQVVEEYKAKYDEEPDNFVLYAYAATQAIAKAASQRAPERSGVRDGLDKLQGLATPVGSLSFNSNGQYPLKKIDWITVRDRKWQVAEKLPRP